MVASTCRRLLACGLLLLGAPTAFTQTVGLVTTDPAGIVTKQFTNAKGVYFDVAPTGAGNASGLADGTYFFQVTDPSGATLYSADPIAKRTILVSAGAIVAAPGGHATQVGPGGELLVQVWPFATGPIGSGSFRLWMVHTRDYVKGGVHHGFPAHKSHVTDFGYGKSGTAKAVQLVNVTGAVFYDIDENGAFNSTLTDEVALPGWRIDYTVGTQSGVLYTDEHGRFVLTVEALAQVTLTSIAPAPGFVGVPGGIWVPTSPTAVSVVAAPPRVNVSFGVIALVKTPQFATSKGYWHNAGEPLLVANDPIWRQVVNGLSLRKNITVSYPPPSPDPTIFKVSGSSSFLAAFDPLSDFLTDPAKGVLANILSTQYCAANLNKTAGPLAGKTTYIDRLGDGVLVKFEDMAAMTLDLLSNPKSCDTGPKGDPVWRAKIQMCLNEWAAMNSSGDNIYTRDGKAPSFGSPY